MLRTIGQQFRRVAVVQATRGASSDAATLANAPFIPEGHHAHQPSPEEYDQKFIAYFSRPEIDGWEIRRAMQHLINDDLIPEPTIISAALRACRRVNDLALAIRILESMRVKCGPKKNVETIYKYIIQEVKPTLDELGIPTPEECGYDKPELWMPSPHNWHHSYYKEYGYDKNPKYTTEWKFA